MKYFLKILIVLVIAVGVVTGVYYYTTGRTPAFLGLDEAHLTTMSKPPATERYASSAMLASLDEEDYQLYLSGSTVILTHGGNSFSFDNWNKLIAEERPQMYLLDADGDSQKELIIRGVCGKDIQTGDNVYAIYILNPKPNEADGYDVTIITQETWRAILDENITQEVTQLKSCAKIVQFTMAAKSDKIVYNDTTGIAESGHSGYARGLQGSDGTYLPVSTWGKAKALYTVTDAGTVGVDVQINISYKGVEALQNAGVIHFEVGVDEENQLYVVEKSLRFNAAEEYTVSPLPDKPAAPWHFTLNNASPQGKKGEIKYVKYSPPLDKSTFTETLDLSTEASDIKYVASVALTETGVVMTAKEGYTFSADAAQSPEFSIIINKGLENEYDISYTAVPDETGTVLTMAFDRAYASDEIETIEINFGAR